MIQLPRRGWAAISRGILLASAAAALAAGLAGCARLPAELTATPTASATTPRLSEAPVTLRIGVPVNLAKTRGLTQAVVTVDAITRDYACPTGQRPPAGRQYVRLDITAVRAQTDVTVFGLPTYQWAVTAGQGAGAETNAALSTGLCLGDSAGALRVDFDATGAITGSLVLEAPSDLTRITATNTLALPPVTLTVELPPQ